MKMISFVKHFSYECSDRISEILMVFNSMREKDLEFPQAVTLVARQLNLDNSTIRAKFTRGLGMPTKEIRKLISEQLRRENNKFRNILLQKTLNNIDIEAIETMI